MIGSVNQNVSAINTVIACSFHAHSHFVLKIQNIHQDSWESKMKIYLPTFFIDSGEVFVNDVKGVRRFNGFVTFEVPLLLRFSSRPIISLASQPIISTATSNVSPIDFIDSKYT